MALTPDGSRLLIASPTENTLACWDLRAVRRGLATLGLDWDASPPPGRVSEPPLVVEVMGGENGDPRVDASRRIAEADRQIALGLGDAALYARRAWVRRRIGDDRGALADLDRAAALRPEDASIQEERARLLLRSRSDHRAAEASYARATALDPGLLEAHSGRGDCLLALGRWSEVAAAYSVVLAARPWDPHAHFGRGRALRRLGRIREAESDLTAAIASAPSDLLPRVWRAACREALGDFEGASEDRSLGLERLAPEQANEAAWALSIGPSDGREPALALPLATRAVSGESRFSAYRNTLGIAYLRLGRDREALAEFEASLRSGDPRQQAFDRYPRALALYRLGRRAAAWSEFLRGVDCHLRHARSLSARERAELDCLLLESLQGLVFLESTRRPGRQAAG